MTGAFVSRFFAVQNRLSRGFDRLLADEYKLDGNHEFRNTLLPRFLRPEMRVFDIGGGATPAVGMADKRRYGIMLTGLDIDLSELSKAPPGAYDRKIEADITLFRGDGEADLAVCQSLLEHVSDAQAALDGVASILKPGGHALIFVPCRNAVFARLNLALPQAVKRRTLSAIYPHMSDHQGFPCRYDRCTPSALSQAARQAGLEPLSLRAFYKSSYFTFFLPLHLLWRGWVWAARQIMGEQAAETFYMVLHKPAEIDPPESDRSGLPPST